MATTTRRESIGKGRATLLVTIWITNANIIRTTGVQPPKSSGVRPVPTPYWSAHNLPPLSRAPVARAEKRMPSISAAEQSVPWRCRNARNPKFDPSIGWLVGSLQKRVCWCWDYTMWVWLHNYLLQNGYILFDVSYKQFYSFLLDRLLSTQKRYWQHQKHMRVKIANILRGGVGRGCWRGEGEKGACSL